jgi:hypothetical protein
MPNRAALATVIVSVSKVSRLATREQKETRLSSLTQ